MYNLHTHFATICHRRAQNTLIYQSIEKYIREESICMRENSMVALRYRPDVTVGRVREESRLIQKVT